MSPFKLPVSYIQALDIGKQSRAGALGLLAYDHFITLDVEVEVVWKQSKRPWTFWLYVFNRFFPLIWLSLDLVPFAPSGITSSKMSVHCIIYLSIDDVVILVSTLCVQAILQLRVYALYEKSKKMRYFLASCCAVEVAVMAVFLGITLAHISELPVVSTSTGCYYSGIFSISALFWLPALVFEPVLCLLVVWKAWGEDLLDRLRRGRPRTALEDAVTADTSKLVKVFARDSLIYFIGIFVELIINTVIWSHYNRYINIVVPWSGALPSILGSRLFLHMREAILFPDRYDSDIVGNSGSGNAPKTVSWGVARGGRTTDSNDTVERV
ncbi:hypothetical protein OF83DRAFT_1283573 [Amylostereum chailletii]|nr:hypothetical protein OF83DRAFT_1283573 [Amylostereum chailletii]